MKRERINLLFSICFVIILALTLVSNTLAVKNIEKDKIDIKLLEEVTKEKGVKAVIILKEDTSKDNFRIMNENFKDELGNEKVRREFTSSKSFSALLNTSDIEILKKDPRVERVEYDYPISMNLDQSTNIINATTTWPIKINGVNLTGKSQTVCIIDTGVDYTHSSLGSCNPKIVSLNGTIESNITESSHNYADSFEGNFTIQRPGYSNIAVFFDYIRLEKGFDFIYIYDSNDNLVANYTGRKDNLWSPNVSGDTIKIRLSTDINTNDLGFHINQTLNGSVSTIYNWSNCSKVIGGVDVINFDEDPMDDEGHGTHVAGIVAANGSINGIAPNVQIYSVKALDENGNGDLSDVAYGIDYCVSKSQEYNISVVSLSLGTSCSNGQCYNSYCDSTYSTVASAINSAVGRNISVVISSGNNGNVTHISAPACVQNATAVGATNDNDVVFYNRGNLLQLLAPGVGITSTCLGGGSCTSSGTSMAAPHVSGAIAIIHQYLSSIGQTRTPKEIETLLNNTGKNVTDSATGKNYSRINIHEAIINLNGGYPIVTLQSPLDITYTNQNKTYSCNSSLININSIITNVTFYIWNSTDLVYNYSLNLTGTYNSSTFYYNFSSQGNYLWNCQYTSNNSLSSFASSNYSIIYDLVKPSLTILSPINNSWYNSGRFNVTINENGTCLYSLNYGNNNVSMSNSNNINFSAMNSTLTQGTNQNVTFYCNDSAGNTNSTQIRFSVDLISPNVSITDPLPQSETSSSTNKIFYYNVSDNLNITSCSLIVNNAFAAYNDSTIVNTTNNISFTFGPGSYSWNINCTDIAGNTDNSSTSSFVITAVRSSGGGGGGGGAGGGATTNTYLINNFELSQGYNNNFGKGDKAKFSLYSGNHTLTVKSFNNNSALIEIASNPFNITLYFGETRKLNMTTNDTYDLQLTLSELINGSKVKLIVKNINEKIFPDIIKKTPEVTKHEENSTDNSNKTVEPKDTSKDNNGLNYIMIIILFAVFLVFFIIGKLIINNSREESVRKRLQENNKLHMIKR